MEQLKRATGAHSVRAVRGVFWSTINSVVPTGASFLVFLVISRYIGPSEYGVVALASSVAALAGVLVPSGFADAIVQRLTISEAELDSVFWASLICSIAAYAIVVACSGLLGRAFGSDLISVVLPVVSLKLISDAVGLVPQAVITRRMSFELIVGRTVLATVASAGITVLLLYAGYDIWAIVIAQLSSSAIASIASMWGAGYKPSLQMKSEAILALARYGVFSSGTRAIQALTTQADPALVGLSLGPSHAGLYAFSRSIFQMIVGIVATPLSTVAHPMFSSIQEETDRVKKGFLTATFLSSALSFPLFIGFSLVADLAVPLVFGTRWIEAIWPIRLYCGLGVMACIGVIQGSLINSRGQTDWWFYYQLAAGLVTVCILLAVSRFGVTVLVSAVLFATVARWPFAVTKSAQLIGMSATEYLSVFAGPVGACIVMAFFVAVARGAFPHLAPIFGLAICVGIGALAYSGAMMLLARDRTMEIFKILRHSLGFSRG